LRDEGPDVPPTVVFLGDRSAATAAVFHALRDELGERAYVRAVLEQRPSRLALARRRARRLGWGTVAGQVAFAGLVAPVLRRQGRRRIAEIARSHGLRLSPVRSATMIESVNDQRTVAILREAHPDVVVVHGTRVISQSVLDTITVPVLNVHAGITPRYRGVHGGYWAFREDRPELAGTTVHLIDAGIDTGGILAQATFVPERADTIATYPYLHLACGIPLLLQQVGTILQGGAPATVPPLPGAEPSQLRWHPTAWDYVLTRVRQRVR
jgi:folate-dependent phosphoribosylglycinamide formyltransferase PurN